MNIKYSALVSRRMVDWILRAWPVLAIAFLGASHALALSAFQGHDTLVNKLAGTTMQVVGGCIVLHSINSNLGLFRNHNLFSSIAGWFRELPIFSRSISVSLNSSVVCTSSGSATTSVTHAPTTIEERLTVIERRMEELQSEMTAKHQAIHAHVDQVRSELSASISSNQTAISGLAQRVEMATVGSFKQQAFGVLLVIYGAVITVVV